MQTTHVVMPMDRQLEQYPVIRIGIIRFSIEGEHIELRPENQKLKPLRIGQQDELKIIGKVLHVCSGARTETLLDDPPRRINT